MNFQPSSFSLHKRINSLAIVLVIVFLHCTYGCKEAPKTIPGNLYNVIVVDSSDRNEWKSNELLSTSSNSKASLPHFWLHNKGLLSCGLFIPIFKDIEEEIVYSKEVNQDSLHSKFSNTLKTKQGKDVFFTKWEALLIGRDTTNRTQPVQYFIYLPDLDNRDKEDIDSALYLSWINIHNVKDTSPKTFSRLSSIGENTIKLNTSVQRSDILTLFKNLKADVIITTIPLKKVIIPKKDSTSSTNRTHFYTSLRYVTTK